MKLFYIISLTIGLILVVNISLAQSNDPGKATRKNTNRQMHLESNAQKRDDKKLKRTYKGDQKTERNHAKTLKKSDRERKRNERKWNRQTSIMNNIDIMGMENPKIIRWEDLLSL